MDELSGYRGEALEFLRRAGAGIGDILEVATSWGKVTGTLVPRYLFDDEGHVVLKLSSGYNVGLRVKDLKGARVVARGEKPAFKTPPPPKSKEGLPRVAILGTGGTIASRVDYKSGAVSPAVSAEELYALIPELSEIAEIEPEILMSVFSENMGPTHWQQIAERVAKAVRDGVDGVVITQGTDTLGYTAAALSFALLGVPIPVVLVGAQRSSDRPSTDAVLNLIGGVSIAARAGFSGVYVVMHAEGSDDRLAVHRGTRVRKNHTSARGAFRSIGVPLAAVWTRDGFEFIDEGLPKREPGGSYRPRTKFEDRVALLKFYPSMPASLVTTLRRGGTRALVFEGTGLGHLNAGNIGAVADFTSKGGLVFMTSQCISGRVDLNVYLTGKELVAAGAVPLEDMLSETALVKAMWALGNSDSDEDASKLMVSNLAGEMTSRSVVE